MRSSTLNNRFPRHRSLWYAAGWVLLLAAWAVVAASQPEYMLPSPARTLSTLLDLIVSEALLLALAATLWRAAVGLLLALLLGCAWGYLSARFPAFHALTMPGLQLLMSTPGIIFVIVAMVWFGTRSVIVVLVVAAVTTPVITTATTQAFTAIDAELKEMVTLFRFPRWRVLRHLVVPSVAPPLLAATTVALGQSIRVAVMAELLASATGMGAAIRLAQINIETAEVFAYALMMTALTFALEASLIAPMKRRFAAHLPAVSGSPWRSGQVKAV
ncbi:MAG: ABC transporter permease subunit [Actinomycetaceae bacterium]|nr:ABC transporter permease subunit [Actinomycetaceae bacterium]